MDTISLHWTALQHDIFSILCIHAGKKLSQREIAKMINASPTAVGNSLKKMSKENMVIIEKNKTINFVSLNRDDRRTIELKRVENLKNIYFSSLSDYLYQELPATTIIVFGSYSRGEDTHTSDIDIAVIGRKQKQVDLKKFEEKLGREISLNFYDTWKSIHTHLKNNILNGILLHGGIEL